MSRPRLYLASASPRRLELLRQVGLHPVVHAVEVDERGPAEEDPVDLVRRLAEAKGRAAARTLESARPGVILAADTAVVVDRETLGKPADAEAAARMLRRLSGRTHLVLTGVFLLRTDDGRAVCETETTHVRFRSYDDEMIRAYVACGEPMDKAGAYGIQGRGALLSEGIEGSWSNVVGLPVERLPEWMSRMGIELQLMLDWFG